MRNPPILVSVIGFFALLGGFGALFFGLRILGFDWFGILGDLPTYKSVGLWGWLAIGVGIGWILTALGLWTLQPWARLLAMLVAGIALFEALLAFIQFPGSGTQFAMALMPIVILWYLDSQDVRAALAGDGHLGWPLTIDESRAPAGGTGRRRRPAPSLKAKAEGGPAPDRVMAEFHHSVRPR